MIIQITSRHLEVTDAIREYVQERLMPVLEEYRRWSMRMSFWAWKNSATGRKLSCRANSICGRKPRPRNRRHVQGH